MKTLLTVLALLLTSACSSVQVNRTMLVSIDEQYVDKADAIELSAELSKEPRWVNLDKAGPQATHYISAKTVCQKNASNWVPYKWVKTCKQYASLNKADTKETILQVTNQTGSTNYNEPLDWSDIVDSLYSQYKNIK